MRNGVAGAVADVEAEHAVLAGLLIDGAAQWQAVGEVLAEDLFTGDRRAAAAAAIARFKAGRPVDAILVAGDMRDAGSNGAAGLPLALVKSVGTAGNLAHYVSRLEQVRERRGAARPQTEVDELQGLSVGRFRPGEERELEEGVPRVPTGWPRLDAALGGGLEVPSLVVLGAGPKSFKSTWTSIVATRHVEAGGFCYVLDLENGRRRFRRRLLCRKSRLGPNEVARALRDDRAGVFATREAAGRWNDAKDWLRGLGQRFLVEHSPPPDLEARLRAVRRLAGEHQLLVVLDSLQKLPGSLEDRRATIDAWIRLLERLRYELNLVVIVVSELKRGAKGYEAGEAAFKESGGIEYAADLAMTLARPRADEDEEQVSTLRVELARDCDEDPRGNVSAYAPVRPFYDLEERAAEGAERGQARPGKDEAARAFLRQRLAGVAVPTADVVRDAAAVGISRSVLYRAKASLGVLSCTVGLKQGWRLP